MGASVRALLRSGVFVLVGLAFSATFVLLGIASVTLRSQCDGEWSLGGCVVEGTPTAVVVQPEAEADRDPIPQLSGRDRALQAANGWIGETFDELAAMPARSSSVAAIAGASAEAEAADEPTAAVAAVSAPEPEADEREAEASAMVAKRTVTTVEIDASGQPVWPTRSAAADAAEAQAGAVGTAGDGDAVTAYAPVPQVRPEGLGEEAASPSAGDLRTVLGSGVNVRSGPSRRNGTVFILAPGSEVTVTGEDGGWLNIRDERGRTGWAYSRYISRG